MRAFMLAGAPNVETKANGPPRRRADHTQHGITRRWTRGATARFSTNLSDSKLSLPRARVNSNVRPHSAASLEITLDEGCRLPSSPPCLWLDGGPRPDPQAGRMVRIRRGGNPLLSRGHTWRSG